MTGAIRACSPCFMGELADLAQKALAAKDADEIAGQASFLRALAKRVSAAAAERRGMKEISKEPLVLLLSDGTLSTDLSLDGILADGHPLNLEMLTLKIAVFAPHDAEISEAAGIIVNKRPMRPTL